jgi:hypothetical protein
VLTRFVRSCLQRQTLRLVSRASFPGEHEGRPESGMRLVVLSGIDYGQLSTTADVLSYGSLRQLMATPTITSAH